ncbi:MAG: FtsX-like permease family protein, partial [Gemmatimonadaceae bacterium]
LSQASLRRREIAVRQVLGATRTRIVRQLLTESIVLSVAGAALGVLLAPVPLRMMRALQPKLLSGVAPAELNVRVLAFAVVVALATGILFGLWPAFRFSREDHSASIKSGGGHGSTSGSSGRIRRLLVSAELALTVMLLIGSGLMLRSFNVLMQRDRGLVSTHVGSLEMTVAATASNRSDRLQKLNEILSRLSAMPGVQSAGAVNDLPLNGLSGISVNVNVPGAPPPEKGRMRFARYLFATRDYFPTMGISLVRGRLFSSTDDSLSLTTALISQKMASEYWPGSDPIGRSFKLGPQEVTVIGIVSDVRESKLENEAGPQMYLHILQSAPSRFSIVARGALPERALLANMTNAVRSVDKSQAVYSVRMMDDVINAYVAPRRANTMLISAFALLALILASVGVFAVVAHGVSHRSRELGIRSALGATGASLVTMLASEMVLVTVAGIVVGLGGAWALAKTLESLVYGVQVHDTMTFVLVPVALLLPTVVATLIPARRALRVNPSEVMRAD